MLIKRTFCFWDSILLAIIICRLVWTRKRRALNCAIEWASCWDTLIYWMCGLVDQYFNAAWPNLIVLSQKNWGQTGTSNLNKRVRFRSKHGDWRSRKLDYLQCKPSTLSQSYLHDLTSTLMSLVPLDAMASREIPQVGPNLTHLFSTTSSGQLVIRFSRKNPVPILSVFVGKWAEHTACSNENPD